MFKKTTSAAVLALALVTAEASLASPVYSNTTTDTLITYVYSAIGADHIGDTVTLEGFHRTVTNASVQFFNLGAGGTFSAALSFWNVGAPVGAQIGASYLLDGLSIGALDILTVTFGNLDLLVPDSVVVTVAISNVASGVDLGLNAFEPPSIGTSDSASIIVGVGNGPAASFSASSTNAGVGNLYLHLEATSVPEPTMLVLSFGAALLVLGAARKKGTQ